MAAGLSATEIQRRAALRGVGVSSSAISAAVAALGIGKHLVLTGPNADQADALAELIADEALDSGLSVGTLIMTGVTSALLGPQDLISANFRNDIWLILRLADEVSLGRLVEYLTAYDVSPSWRFLATSSGPAGSSIAALSAAGRRRLALVNLS